MTSPERFDVLVIGGGIHGVGVAQAAVAAGHTCLLLEQQALAAGTSSRSSKLIHGGLRYLETFQLALVRESLRERELLLKLAPSLVRRQPFLIPVYPQTSRRPLMLHAGLAAYAILAGLRRHTGYRLVPRAKWDSLDGLRTEGLQRVFQYWDAQTDDRALTEAVMRSAESLGAVLRSPAQFRHADVAPAGCHAVYDWQGGTREVAAAVIVNAAGPWGREVADRIVPRPPTPAVDLVQGTHIELPGALTQGCYYVEAPQDGRAVFAMPWRDRTLVGTTEYVYRGDPAKVCPTSAEIDYLREVAHHYFPHRETRVLDQWAGLRVLPASARSATGRSRETQLPVDDATRPRVISIFGGKLTGYRATAEKVIDRLAPSLKGARKRADTRRLPLTT